MANIGSNPVPFISEGWRNGRRTIRIMIIKFIYGAHTANKNFG